MTTSIARRYYTNPDLDAVAIAKRTWGVGNYISLWIGMAFSIPAYMLASSLMAGGMNWWQSLATIFIGNVIVLLPMLLNGHAGAKYGIPFPILARSSFGIQGANVPALLRAFIACGWFGIQTWVGGTALYQLLLTWIPAIGHLPAIFPAWLQLPTGEGLGFLLFWAINMWVVWHGIEMMRKVLVYEAILMIMLSLLAIIWALFLVDGGKVLDLHPTQTLTTTELWRYFWISLTGIVGYFSTICLNIPDFTRYAKSQGAHLIGQTIALPLAITIVAFIGVITTSAASLSFGQLLWNPVELAGHLHSPWLVTAIMLVVILGTLVTNVSANIVSPANDFSHTFPAKISFKMGGLITGILGILICPWRLIADPKGYIFVWLSATSGLLGSVVGILIFDYYYLRKKRLELNELYSTPSRYWFHAGINWNALVALLLGIAVNLPGFLAQVNVITPTALPTWLTDLYHFAWFIGFAVSSLSYCILMKLQYRNAV